MYCLAQMQIKILLDREYISNTRFFYFGLGTTWTQEMVWCIMNNLDYKLAKENILEKRVPFFEYVTYRIQYSEVCHLMKYLFCTCNDMNY